MRASNISLEIPSFTLVPFLPSLPFSHRWPAAQQITAPSMTDEERDEQFYRDTESVAHAKLDDRQLAMLEPLGTRRIVRRGELIFKAGQRDLPLIVILRGEVEVFEARDEQEQILATPGARDFIGEVGMLTGTAALGSAR